MTTYFVPRNRPVVLHFAEITHGIVGTIDCLLSVNGRRTVVVFINVYSVEGIGAAAHFFFGYTPTQEIPVGRFFECQLHTSFIDDVVPCYRFIFGHVYPAAYFVELIHGIARATLFEVDFGIVEQNLGIPPDNAILAAGISIVVIDLLGLPDKFFQIISRAGVGRLLRGAIGCEVGSPHVFAISVLFIGIMYFERFPFERTAVIEDIGIEPIIPVFVWVGSIVIGGRLDGLAAYGSVFIDVFCVGT